jgi:hypothetical protein
MHYTPTYAIIVQLLYDPERIHVNAHISLQISEHIRPHFAICAQQFVSRYGL